MRDSTKNIAPLIGSNKRLFLRNPEQETDQQCM